MDDIYHGDYCGTHHFVRNYFIPNFVSPRTVGKFVIVILLLAGSMILQAQMPEWKFFKDREGNTYYIDQAGKIRITEVRARYMPVSAKAIDYCLHNGITLINDHKLPEGLTVLKSILAMPADNNRIYSAQVKASEMINFLKRRHGTRYSALNESASLMLVQQDSFIEIINDQMFYSFRVPIPLEVIRVRRRGGVDYRYSGVLVGIGQAGTAAKPHTDGGYDILFAIDSEKFSVPVRDLDRAIEKWRNNIGYDDLKREIQSESESRVVYRFRSTGAPFYAGIEAIIINGSITHCIRFLSSDAKYNSSTGTIQKILLSFKTISSGD